MGIKMLGPEHKQMGGDFWWTTSWEKKYISKEMRKTWALISNKNEHMTLKTRKRNWMKCRYFYGLKSLTDRIRGLGCSFIKPSLFICCLKYESKFKSEAEYAHMEHLIYQNNKARSWETALFTWAKLTKKKKKSVKYAVKEEFLNVSENFLPK